MHADLPNNPQATVAAVRAALVEVFHEVDAWFDRPSDERAFRPASGGWTIDEILEHIGLTNHFLMVTFRKAVDRAVARVDDVHGPSETATDLERLDPIGRHGSFAWKHPAHMEPRGAMTSAEVRARIAGQVAECLTLLDRLGQGEGRLAHLHMSVNGLGRIDLYQWLHFLTQHARRHLHQLASNQCEFQRGRGQAHPG